MHASERRLISINPPSFFADTPKPRKHNPHLDDMHMYMHMYMYMSHVHGHVHVHVHVHVVPAHKKPGSGTPGDRCSYAGCPNKEKMRSVTHHSALDARGLHTDLNDSVTPVPAD